MKVLHLLSDWKWTGPAEPVVNLCRALQDQGLEVVLACRTTPMPDYPVSIEGKARERGLRVVTRFHLNRYLAPMETIRDLWRLPGYVEQEGFQLINCHLSHDHILGGWASRLSHVPVVRTNHKARPLERTVGNRWLLGRWADGLIEFSRLAAHIDARVFDLPGQRLLVVEGAVDLRRFDPNGPRADVRPAMGVSPQEVLVGVVARMQRHRRWELLLQAMALLAKRIPQVKLMILGRGTHMKEVALEPAMAMGLGGKVIFPGYRREDYVDYLHAMDMKVFLVPGSDGTCRAVREAMAMGKPVVATRRGVLPELVEDGKTGILVDEDPEALANAIERLALDAPLRESMARAARDKALKSFSQEMQASEVARFYERILSLGPRRGGLD